MILSFPNESRFEDATIDRLELLGFEYANGRELRENQFLSRTRDYLLSMLLSGEVEVKVAEKQIAETV